MLSCRIVGIWRQHSDEVMDFYRNIANDSVSLISDMEGNIHKRPDLDVPAWKSQNMTQASGAPSFMRSFGGNQAHSHNRQLHTKDFDKVLTDLGLDAKMPQSTLPKGKIKLVDKILLALHLKKIEKESEKEQVEMEDAPRPKRHSMKLTTRGAKKERSEEGERQGELHRPRGRHDQPFSNYPTSTKDLKNDQAAQITAPPRRRVRRKQTKMQEAEVEREIYVPRRRVRREKAKPESQRTNIKREVPQISMKSQQHEASRVQSSRSNTCIAALTSKNLRIVDGGFQQQQGYDPSESLLSSRPSETNLGSIVNRPDLPDEPRAPPLRTPARAQNSKSAPVKPPHRSSRPAGSRPQSRSQTAVQTPMTEMTSTSSAFSQRRVTVPTSLAPVVPSAPKRVLVLSPDFTKHRERRRSERNDPAPAPPAPLHKAVERSEGMHADQRIASDDARERRVGRGQRDLNAAVTKKYHQDERERAFGHRRGRNGIEVVDK